MRIRKGKEKARAWFALGTCLGMVLRDFIIF